MAQQDLTPYEIMEIQELLNFKTVCLTKSKMMQDLVMDQELKNLMQREIDNCMRIIEELRSMLRKDYLQ